MTAHNPRPIFPNQRGPVLDTAARLHDLALGRHLAHCALSHACQVHHGRPACMGEYVACMQLSLSHQGTTDPSSGSSPPTNQLGHVVGDVHLDALSDGGTHDQRATACLRQASPPFQRFGYLHTCLSAVMAFAGSSGCIGTCDRACRHTDALPRAVPRRAVDVDVRRACMIVSDCCVAMGTASGWARNGAGAAQRMLRPTPVMFHT